MIRVRKKLLLVALVLTAPVAAQRDRFRTLRADKTVVAVFADVVAEANASTVVVEQDDERVVYEATQHEVCVLNPTAAWFFDLCDGERRVADILEIARERFDVPLETLQSDLIQTLTGLRDKGLLT